MSLHDKILKLNAELLSKGITEFTPSLPDVEPKPYIAGKKLKWNNVKLNNQSLTSNEKLFEICNKIEIKKITITSVNDVANLLEVPVGQLLYILYHKKNNYKQFMIKKKNGDFRLIYAPQQGLAILQKKLLPILEYFYRPKKSAHGFIKGKSIYTNAKKHIKKKYVVNIDLENYFGTVTFARVYGIFKSHPFNFSHPAASVLSKLCTHNGFLPQGACTSPIIANLVSVSLDKQLTKLANKRNITYTRYADDITFSFNENRVNDFITVDSDGSFQLSEIINSIVINSGFLINYSKFRVQKNNVCQKVTGLVVNNKVNIDRNYIRVTRSMIHKWRTDKLTASLLFSAGNGYITKSNSHAISIFRNHIYGRLSFIKMIRGGDFSVYLKLMSQMSHNDSIKTKEGLRAMTETETYDIFICHASEDKDNIATPIYEELTKLKVKAFIDHMDIKWGDSLVDKINSALAKSKYVIAILSANSVEKNWPLKELSSVLSREISSDTVKLLTLLKKGDEDIISDKLPLLSDKLYAVYDDNPKDIAEKIFSRLSE